MRTKSATATDRPLRRRAFSYVEALISTIILGTAIATGMSLYGSYAQGALMDAERSDALQLCSDLLVEILAKEFEEPAAAAGSFGPGPGETSRLTFNDVDDYDGWSEGPPRTPKGDIIGDERLRDCERKVQVYNVLETDLAVRRTNGSTAAKAIRVYVVKNKKVLAELTGHRMRYTK
jgi:hypothetical protein